MGLLRIAARVAVAADELRGAEKIYEDGDVVVSYLDWEEAVKAEPLIGTWYRGPDDYHAYVIDVKRPAAGDPERVFLACKRWTTESGRTRSKIGDSMFGGGKHVAGLPHSGADLKRLIEKDAAGRPEQLEYRIRSGKMSQEELLAIADHGDAYVREQVAQKLEPQNLLGMIDDPDAHVRAAVAKHLDKRDLPKMMGDEDAYVRRIVAWRIDASYLPEMMKDEDPSVRAGVARKIDKSYLPQMAEDSSAMVRFEVEQRTDPEEIAKAKKEEEIRGRKHDRTKKRVDRMQRWRKDLADHLEEEGPVLPPKPYGPSTWWYDRDAAQKALEFVLEKHPKKVNWARIVAGAYDPSLFMGSSERAAVNALVAALNEAGIPACTATLGKRGRSVVVIGTDEPPTEETVGKGRWLADPDTGKGIRAVGYDDIGAGLPDGVTDPEGGVDVVWDDPVTKKKVLVVDGMSWFAKTAAERRLLAIALRLIRA